MHTAGIVVAGCVMLVSCSRTPPGEPPAASGSSAPARSLPSTAVSQAYPLDTAKDGFDGSLQLVIDPARASVRLVDAKGSVVDEAMLEEPRARMAPERLYEGTVYAVEVDHTRELGSYNGPITSFLEIRDGHLHFLEGFDTETGAFQRIAIMKSLKTAWRYEPARAGKGRDILAAACRPTFHERDASGPTFTVILARYAFENGRWVVHRKRTPGFLEFEDESAFPPSSAFP